MPTGASPLCRRDNVIGMPISAVTSRAVSGARASRASASRSSAAARSAGPARGHEPVSKASRAARTAVSTSGPVPAGADPTISSVAGLATVIRSGETAGSSRPPA